jgi:RNA polymerase sigma factor (TIGR02999 family)
LKQWGKGNDAALQRLTDLLYDELRRLARAYVRQERSDATLQSAGLVHEAYLRLVDIRRTDWQDRSHFFAVAAKIMRRILVDTARRRRAAKRGGRDAVEAIVPADLDALPGAHRDAASRICELDDALEALALIEPRRAQVVEMRFFAGLSVEETAQALRVSAQTVMRDWRLARTWLSRELARVDHDPGKCN